MSTVKTEQIVADILLAFEPYIIPERREFARISYPTSMEILGLRNPDLKLILKELRSICNSLKPKEKVDLAKLLVARNIMECQQLAYEFLNAEKQALALLGEKDITALSLSLDNWASVDTFGCYVLGVIWRNQQVSDATILQLCKDEDVWKRRLALSCTIALNTRARGGKGDAGRTLMIGSVLVDDHEDMVVKALSWSLRSLILYEPQMVKDFLDTYHQRLHKRVLREVNNKLQTGLKNPS